MNPWQIIGVERTATKRDIKRAYSKLIKQHRPDDSPKEFQLIRDAYEQLLATVSEDLHTSDDKALEQVASTQTETPLQKPLTEPTQKISEPTTGDHTIEADVITKQSEENISEKITAFIDLFEQLIGRFPAKGKLSSQQLEVCRIDTASLIRADILSHWHAREYLADSVFNSLCSNIAISSGLWSTTTNFPSQFLQYLDEHFMWTENEITLIEACEDDSAGLVFYCIHEARNSSLQRWAAWPVDTTTTTTIEQQPSVPLTLKIKSWFSKST